METRLRRKVRGQLGESAAAHRPGPQTPREAGGLSELRLFGLHPETCKGLSWEAQARVLALLVWSLPCALCPAPYALRPMPYAFTRDQCEAVFFVLCPK